MIIDIPGGTATLRDTITIKERRNLRAIAMEAISLAGKIKPDAENVTLDPGDAALMLATNDKLADATVLAFLMSWTIDKPLPTAETLVDMDGDVYDAISEALEKQSDALMGVDTSPNKDKQSPMQDLPSLDGTSKDEPTPTPPSTSTSSTGTESTSLENSTEGSLTSST